MILTDLVQKGGVAMWPLLALAFISVLIISDRLVVIVFKGKNKLRFVKILELIAQVAPVIGFLGTVLGIMDSFRELSLSASVTIQTVSGGMYMALYTTAFGLVISIADSVFAQLIRWGVKDGSESC